MYHPSIPAASAAFAFNRAQPENRNPEKENKLELFFSKGEATLFAGGERLIYFRSPVQVSGQEVLDWMKKGYLTELLSLENLATSRGIVITARETAPVRQEKPAWPEQSERSLLLNPQWFSIYFIAISGGILPGIAGGGARTDNAPRADRTARTDKTALSELYATMHAFFEPGRAIADYENRGLYLRGLRNPRAVRSCDQ